MSPDSFEDAQFRALRLGIAQAGNAPLRVLQVMIRRADPIEFQRTGELISWPAHYEIAAEAGIHRVSARAIRKILVAAGLISRIAERNGARDIGVYRIHQHAITPDEHRLRAMGELNEMRRRKREWLYARHAATAPRSVKGGLK
jgi:hypothetical protein